MDDATLARSLPALLADLWGLEDVDVRPLGGGMNSATCLVTATGGDRFVAKWSSDAESLEAGCSAATLLGRQGVRTGGPVGSTAGAPVVALAGGALALLRHVPGRELDGDSGHEQQLIGTALATVHTAGCPAPDTGPFMSEWLYPAEDVLAVATWLPPALAEIRREYNALPQLTWTQLHTDPAPEAFIHDDATGSTGLIDWAGSRRGPALYDVASAVMYLGGPQQAEQFLSSYADRGPVENDELALLDIFRRFRWAIQASYFAGRIVADDRTGIVDDTDHNTEALARARRGLAEAR